VILTEGQVFFYSAQSIGHLIMSNHFKKSHKDLISSFLVILSLDRQTQTDRQTQVKT